MNQQKVAEFLKMQRKERGLTQQNVGELLFVSREAVSKWERAINLPDYTTMLGLSQLYNLSINEILAGEMITDANRDKINAVAMRILLSERKKRKKMKFRFMTLIFFILAICGLIYFIYNYNSLKVYRTYAANDDYYLSQGMIVTSKQRSFIQLGNLYDASDNTLINDEDIESIKFYFDDKKQTKVFLEATRMNNVYLDLIEYNRFIKKNNLKKVMKNLYIDITNKKNEVSTLQLDNVLTYSNDDILPTLLKGEKAYKAYEEGNNIDIPDIVKNHFKLKDDKYIYELKVDKKTTYQCEYDKESNAIVFSSTDFTINGSYDFVRNEILLNVDDKIIIYSYGKKKCLSGQKECEKYTKFIDAFSKQLLDKTK